jgi:two-component system, OmpR family, sensor histidine kinase ChvG
VTSFTERVRSVAASRIGRMLFAFNLLLVFVPAAGVLYLDVYEEQLLGAQERGMIQQARLVAAAAAELPDPSALERMLGRLERHSLSRVRLYDARGTLLADSARTVDAPREDDAYVARSNAPTRGRPLYRVGMWIVQSLDWVRSWRPTPSPVASSGPSNEMPPEVGAALAGRYGAATRRTPGQRSLTLYSALPVRRDGAIVGAVVVSQSTFRILQALYETRLRIFEIVIASIAMATGLTLAATFRIVRPLVRLRRRAIALAEHRAGQSAAFPESQRRDEVGDLARALEELTRRLDEHISLLESVAGDVAHEFKNPLASIRTAAEMIRSSDSVERERFVALLLQDVDRLERLVSGVRELARIDGALESEPIETVDVQRVISEVADGLRLLTPGANRVVIRHEGLVPSVRGSAERLRQVFENLLANAISFAPDGPVEVTITAEERTCRITVADSGPGIPDSHLARVFERFFTYRPMSGRGHHIGLGLAIARTIVGGYGGTITAANRPGGGAVFEVRLHRTTPADPEPRDASLKLGAIPPSRVS